MFEVRFISCEDDGIDQIVSFAIEDDAVGIRSLILLRTPKHEAILDQDERGVSVSLEYEDDDEVDLLKVMRIEAQCVAIETQASKYELDTSRVESAEISEMKALLGRMNFDNRFRLEGV